MSPICVAEFPTRETRENILKTLAGKTLVGDLKFDRAKTAMQLKRNSALRQACDLLKKDVRCSGKSVEIIWQMEDKKDRSREITVDHYPVFRQNFSDLSGQFLGEFTGLQV